MFPSTGRVNNAILVDGTPLTAGQIRGHQVVVRESYEVLDYASLYDTAKANIGTSYTALNIAGAVRVTNTFTFTAGGRCRVSTTFTELKPTTLAACGGVQSNALAKAGATTTRYVPGVGTIGGFNWGAGVDLTSYSSSLLVTTSNLLSASVPPIFSLDRLIASSATVAGFAIGYLPFGVRSTDSSINATRLTAAPTDLWDLRSTKKSYPSVFTSQTAGWGRLTVEAFRTYLTAAQTDAVIAAGTDGLAAWSALDAQASLS
jgi:hypothetical protein